MFYLGTAIYFIFPIAKVWSVLILKSLKLTSVYDNVLYKWTWTGNHWPAVGDTSVASCLEHSWLINFQPEPDHKPIWRKGTYTIPQLLPHLFYSSNMGGIQWTGSYKWSLWVNHCLYQRLLHVACSANLSCHATLPLKVRPVEQCKARDGTDYSAIQFQPTGEVFALNVTAQPLPMTKSHHVLFAWHVLRNLFRLGPDL